MYPIEPDDTPDPNVPLSSAMAHDGTVFVSGQVPFDMKTGDVVGDDIAEQTEQTFDNIEAILEADGMALDDVIKTTVFLVDVDDFDGMNSVYRRRMTEPYPARSAVEVSDLAADILVEIEAIAVE